MPPQEFSWGHICLVQVTYVDHPNRIVFGFLRPWCDREARIRSYPRQPTFMWGLGALSHMLNLKAGISPSIQELGPACYCVSLYTVYLTPSGHIAPMGILQTSISARSFPPGLQCAPDLRAIGLIPSYRCHGSKWWWFFFFWRDIASLWNTILK